MLGMFFSGFLFISTHISLDLLSLSSAEAYIGRGGKLNGHLIKSSIRNIRTKNNQNLIIGFQVTVENVGDAFLGHSVCHLCEIILHKLWSYPILTIISHSICSYRDNLLHRLHNSHLQCIPYNSNRYYAWSAFPK